MNRGSVESQDHAGSSRSAKWVAGLGLGLLLFGLPGCSHQDELIDLAARCPHAEARTVPHPLPRVHVRLVGDRRPLSHQGRRSYLGHSYFTQDVLLEPLEVVVLRVLARDLVESGLAAEAGIRDEQQSHTLSVTLKDGTAQYSEGIENITLVIPTSRVEGSCRFHLRLTDGDGRVLLDREFAGSHETTASLAGGLEDAAAESFLAALRMATDQALAAIAELTQKPGIKSIRGS